MAASTELHTKTPTSLVLPTGLAFAPPELFPQFTKFLGIVKDVGDAFLLLGRGIAVGLRFLRLGGLDAAVLNAAPQLIDGQASTWPSGGDGVEIGAVGVLVREDGSAGRFQTARFAAPLRPTGEIANVCAPAFGFTLEGLACLYVPLC